MKHYYLLALCAALLFTSCNNKPADGADAEAEADTVTAGLRIAYVEVDSLMTQYQFCKDHNLQLNQKGERAQSTLAQKQRALQNHANALQKKYENNGFTTRDELERAQNQLAREQQDLAELEQRLMAELANEQAELTAELRDSIQAFLRVYNQAHHYDYILSRQGDNILVANRKYDITRDVVAGLNKRYKPSAAAQEARKAREQTEAAAE